MEDCSKQFESVRKSHHDCMVASPQSSMLAASALT
jgi:hypothetical protein